MLMMPLVIQVIANDDDRQYMEWLYTEHNRLMFATAWTFSNSRSDVEDIVSDSCVSLIGKISLLRSMEHNALRSYIVSTVRNTAIDFCRKQRLKNATFQPGEDTAIEQLADKVTVEGRIMLREELRIVQAAIAQLTPHERDILRLKYQQGKNDREIAELIGLSESSIRKYVVRARQHLKDAIYWGD